MKMLVGIVFGFLALPVLASDDCYGTFHLGKSRVRGIKTGFEDRLFDHRYVEGGYHVSGSSRTTSFGMGCTLGDTWALEFDRREGFRAFVESRGSLGVRDYTLGEFHLKRFAEVEGYGLSLVGSYPLTKRFFLTARLGVLVGTERVGISSEMLPDDWSVVRERRGYLPIVGLGLRFQESHRLAWTIEQTWYSDSNQFRELRSGFRYAF